MALLRVTAVPYSTWSLETIRRWLPCSFEFPLELKVSLRGEPVLLVMEIFLINF